MGNRRPLVSAIGALALCLPCLIPLLIVLGISAGALSTLGAWFASNGLLIAAGAAFIGAVGWLVVTRWTKGAACDLDEEEPSRTQPEVKP